MQVQLYGALHFNANCRAQFGQRLTQIRRAGDQGGIFHNNWGIKLSNYPNYALML
jgi:hypothetical protein